jgi:hypothetical protein
MDYDKAHVKRILMERDGDSAEEAQDRIDAAQEEIDSLIEDGDLLEAEDVIADHFGLEPDFVMDFIPMG